MYASVANYTGQYLILMVDPDASTPENPTRRFILHWLAPNATQADGTDGLRQITPPSSSATGVADLVSYQPPTPGNTSSAHRYIIYAFQQPASFVFPSSFSGFGSGAGQTRAGFNVSGFIEAAGLGRPAAAEYFYVSRKSEVPGGFVALAGGTYPGGNGGAIFEDSANASGTATATASGTGAASTATGTGTTTAGAVRWDAARLFDGVWGLAAVGVLALML